MQKCDVLDMLLLRRFFAACYEFDTLFSVNIWSDSSPASGEELQGILIDVLLVDGTSERIVLPGSTLPYGLVDAVSKSIAVLHGLWCIAGPRHDVLAYVLSKVMSVTTDFGTEIRTVEMKDCSLAYVKAMQGCRMDSLLPFVNEAQRWLPFAIRISGWSHTMGNIAKQVAESCPLWENFILRKLQAMVSFYKIGSWRNFIRMALELDPKPDFDSAKLKSFTASFAHWRYETITDVMGQLLVFRTLSQRYMMQEWFANAQDRALIRDAFDAFSDDRLWRFVQASHSHVFSHIERARHWGMVCKCHAQERHEGQRRVECYWNSRKLPWAADFLTHEIDAKKTESRALTPQQCEGDDEVHQYVKNMTLKTSTLLRQRMGYLCLPPWTAARCRTPENAKAFLEQVQATPMEKHDPYTRWFMQALGQHVVARSEGLDLHVDLENELDRLATTPLDESCGEGYHRDVTYEHKRATRAKQIHLKQTTRRKGVFRRLRVWRRVHGKRGRSVLRWEWRNWKRIVQPDHKRLWRPAKWSPARVLQRVYREDSSSLINWGTVVNRETNVHHASPGEVESSEACWNEFLRGQVNEGRHYSCEQQAPAPNTAASSTDVVPVPKPPAYFQ